MIGIVGKVLVKAGLVLIRDPSETKIGTSPPRPQEGFRNVVGCTETR